jgi:hypothetical protein
VLARTPTGCAPTRRPRARARCGALQLEDHAVSFCADLAQSLVIVEDAGPEGAAMLKDGGAIQRTHCRPPRRAPPRAGVERGRPAA